MELQWSFYWLATLGVASFAFFPPQLIEYFAQQPERFPHHRGLWIVAWLFAVPILIENRFVQLALSGSAIIATYLVDRFCVKIGCLLRQTDWSWLPRLFFRPRLNMWDEFAYHMCFPACFNVAMFTVIYSAVLLMGKGEALGSSYRNLLVWLIFFCVIALWLKWMLSRHYSQIEAWIDDTWRNS